MFLQLRVSVVRDWKRIMKRMVLVAGCVAIGVAVLGAQGRNAARPQPARPQPTPAFDATATLKDAANALGMLRQANRMDAINTMEFWGTGTTNALGQQYHADGPWPAFRPNGTRPSALPSPRCASTWCAAIPTARARFRAVASCRSPHRKQ